MDLKSYSFGKKLKIMIVNDKWREFFMLCTTCKKKFTNNLVQGLDVSYSKTN